MVAFNVVYHYLFHNTKLLPEHPVLTTDIGERLTKRTLSCRFTKIPRWWTSRVLAVVRHRARVRRAQPSNSRSPQPVSAMQLVAQTSGKWQHNLFEKDRHEAGWLVESNTAPAASLIVNAEIIASSLLDFKGKASDSKALLVFVSL